MRLIINLLVFSLVVGSLQSCVSKQKYDELAASKEASDQALAETQAKVAELESKNSEMESSLNSERDRMNGEISSLRNDLNATNGKMAQVQEKLNMTEEQLNKLKEEIDGIFSAYEKSGLSLEERDGRLYVVTSQPVNYRSGSARLSSDERKALSDLAETLKSNPSLKILVEGHTDTDGMKEGAPWADNWELSVSRAMGVVRQLLKSGVNPDQVAAVGRGEYMPAASNDSSEGKAKNRRTVVLPDANLSGLRKKN